MSLCVFLEFMTDLITSLITNAMFKKTKMKRTVMMIHDIFNFTRTVMPMEVKKEKKMERKVMPTSLMIMMRRTESWSKGCLRQKKSRRAMLAVVMAKA